MSAVSVHIAIGVRVDGDEISGHATDGGGQSKGFCGWLGLIGALDALGALLTSRITQAEGRGTGA